MPRRKHGEPRDLNLRQQAVLIASGHIPFPPQIAANEALELAREVQELRRQQLLRWLASEFARFLSTHPSKVGAPHVT